MNQQLDMFVKGVGSELDIIVGILSALGSTVLVFVGYIAHDSGTMEIGAAVLLGSSAYLLLKRKVTSKKESSFSENTNLALIAHIIFFLSFAASLFLMNLSLFRPFIYFVLTSVCVAAVALGILTSTTKVQIYVLLVEIVMISLSLRFGLIYEFPGFFGTDPWVHWGIISDWLEANHITALAGERFTKYASFPVMHLNILFTNTITGLDPKNSYYLATVVLYATSGLVVFLLGQILHSSRVGLLAALLLSIDVFNISWGGLMVPTSLGPVFFVVVMWMVCKKVLTIVEKAILVLIFLTMVYLHPLVSLAMSIALTLFYMGTKLFGRLGERPPESAGTGLNLLILLWVGTIASWLVASASPSSTLFEGLVATFFITLSTGVEFVGGAFQASETQYGPLNRIGFLAFVGLIIVGSLSWLQYRNTNNKRLAVLLTAFGLALLTFVFPLFNINNLIPGRWLPYVSMLGVFPAAVGIMWLSSSFDGKIVQSWLTVAIVFVLSFFLINSVAVNTRGPFYGREYMESPFRNSFLDSELTAAETILELYQGKIKTDGFYTDNFVFGNSAEHDRFIKFPMLVVNQEVEGLAIVREYLYDHPLNLHKSIPQSSDAFLTGFKESGYSFIYNNGQVKAYLSRAPK